MNRLNLKELELNFYANHLEVEGATNLANGLANQKQLTKLNLDLYFNKIAEKGTQAIA